MSLKSQLICIISRHKYDKRYIWFNVNQMELNALYKMQTSVNEKKYIYYKQLLKELIPFKKNKIR